MDPGFAVRVAALAWLASIATAAAQQRFNPEPQSEGFRICNRTGWQIEVAKAVNTAEKNSGGDIIHSQGWYQLAPGTCMIAYSGTLEYQYYLVYGQAKQVGKEWAGKIPVCVSREPFSIRANLCGPNFNRRMFFEVNIGDSRSGFTQNFNP